MLDSSALRRTFGAGMERHFHFADTVAEIVSLDQQLRGDKRAATFDLDLLEKGASMKLDRLVSFELEGKEKFDQSEIAERQQLLINVVG